MSLPTRDQAVRDAGSWLADRLAHLDSLSPREVAEQAAAGRTDVDPDAVEDRVRADRGLPPIDRTGRAA